MPVGGRNYPYCIWEGKFRRHQNCEANSDSYLDKALSGLRTLAPKEIPKSIQPTQLDSQELKSEFLTHFLPAF